MKNKNKSCRTIITAAIILMLSFGCAGDHNNDDLAILGLLGADGELLSSQASDIGITLTIPDNDKDLIADNLEAQLMRKFAPKYYLHPQETAMPTSVAWTLPHTQLKHNTYRRLCKDKVVLNWGRVTSKNLSMQSIRGLTKWPFCKAKNERYYSNRDYNDDNTFYLSISSSKFGGSLSAAKCYARVGITRKSSAKYEIEYWFFYAWNPSIGAGKHEGDWEHIKVYVTDQQKVHSVDYAAHGTPKNFPASHPSLNLVGGLRPDVYSARGTHASHPNVGRFTTFNLGLLGKVYEETAKDPRGIKVVDCAAAGRTINVGNYAYPTRGNEWVKYKGDWGYKKDLKRSLTQIAGPGGPKMRGIDWNNEARIHGPVSLNFPKNQYGSQNHTYTFDARLAKKLGQTRITQVTTSDGYNARAVKLNDTQIRVTFRRRQDVSRATYTLTVRYSVPKAGGIGTRVAFSRTKRVTATYEGGGQSGCGGGDQDDRFAARKICPQ